MLEIPLKGLVITSPIPRIPFEITVGSVGTGSVAAGSVVVIAVGSVEKAGGSDVSLSQATAKRDSPRRNPIKRKRCLFAAILNFPPEKLMIRYQFKTQ